MKEILAECKMLKKNSACRWRYICSLLVADFVLCSLKDMTRKKDSHHSWWGIQMCLKNINKLSDIEVKKRRNVVKVEKPKILHCQVLHQTIIFWMKVTQKILIL